MAKIEIAPRLRELGLKGSGQKVRLPSETHLLTVLVGADQLDDCQR